MSRIKLLLNLVVDMRSVADDLQILAEALASDDEQKDTKVQQPPQTSTKEESTPLRLEDVRAVLAAKSRDGYGAQVREIIAKYGGSKLSDVKPTDYAAVLKDAEGFGNAS